MGFRPKERTQDIVCDWEILAPDEGSEPLTATIRTGLTFAEIDAIPTLDATYQAMYEAVAPYVLAWNCESLNHETGAVEPIPPPAVGGPIVLQAVDPWIGLWLAASLKTAHLGGLDRKKKSMPSNATPAPKNANGSGSRRARATSHRSQTTTT